MSKRIAKVLDTDGQFREAPDFPIAVVRQAVEGENSLEGTIVDPVFTHDVARNLYGRIMTLVEATTEASKLKAVKDIFGKELSSWEQDVYRSAREVASIAEVKETGGLTTGPSINNIYTR